MSDNYKQAPLAEGERRVSVFQEKAPYSPLAETARAFGQGLTFGTLDEIEAALRTGSISGAEYEKQRKNNLAKMFLMSKLQLKLLAAWLFLLV